MLTVEYDPNWPGAFLTIRGKIEPYLSDACIVEHVGSTSVPGMRAKPIIDIDVICPDGRMSRTIATVERAGYRHEGDNGIPTREAFAYAGDVELPTHHLYACEASSPELRRHLAFRDFLRHHQDWRTRLSALKLQLTMDPSITRDEYQRRKSSLVDEILKLALAD